MTVANLIALQSFVIPQAAFSPDMLAFTYPDSPHRQNFEKDLKRAKHAAGVRDLRWSAFQKLFANQATIPVSRV